MKKNIIYIGFILLTTLLSSCESNFLDLSDPDSFDVPKYYQTEQDMIDALTAAYGATRTFYNYMFYVTEMKSDNATTSNTGDSGGLYSTFITHNVTSNNAIVGYIWNGLYNCIYKCNLVLKYIDNVPMSEESYASIVSQAKYLRALSHFYLVRLFGKIPVCDAIVETVEDAKNATRQPIEDAYELIVNDLQAVVECEYLPTFIENTSDDFGRVTSTAGAALLGKVFLTMAVDFDDPSYYIKAITFLEKACALANVYDFPPTLTFPKVFGIANEGNEEIIFQCMYLATSTEFSSFAYDFQPYGQVGITSNITGRGCNFGEETLYNAFEEGDRRKATTIMVTADGSSYYTKKYVDLSNANGYGGNNWIETRFADVFLMLAEAYEAQGKVDEAKTYLDKVRVRASLSTYDEAGEEYYAAHPSLRDAIFHERRLELAFENHRWFDLQRMFPDKKELVAYMNSLEGPKYTEFKEYELLLPIPYDEVQINPDNFYQNTGY